MKKVYYIPVNSDNVMYCKLIKKAIYELNYEIIKCGQFASLFKADIVHFNWYESFHTDNKFKLFIRYLKKKTYLNLLKLLNKKIVFTLHNKMPHDFNNKYQIKIMKWLIKKSDKIIIHCKYSYDVLKQYNYKFDYNKIVYIPLPNFIDVYENKKEYNFINNNDMVLLFMGLVRPYKNVETIIEAANELKDKNIKFLICGKCSSEEYKNKLQELIKSDNVITDFRFIEDEEVFSLISKCDLMVLPYSSISSLNSSAAILSFSEGKSVISTNVGTVIDLADQNLVYSYEYSDDNEIHKNRLVNKILEAYDDYNKGLLEKKGNLLKDKMKKENSSQVIKELLKQVYM